MTQHHRDADEAAARIIEQKQQEALGRVEPFTIETPAETLRRRLIEAQGLPYSHAASLGSQALPAIAHWPDDDLIPPRAPPAQPTTAPTTQPIVLSLNDALQVGARSSREYQSAKENVFLEALGLDLERDEFRATFSGMITGDISTDLGGDETVAGAVVSPEVGVSQRLKNGMLITSRIAVDLAKLLTGDRSFSRGILADASISMPLLRGAGRHIVTEPLTQAERDVVYAIFEFEDFKRSFAVNLASQYYGVLQQLDQVVNAEANYRSLISSTRRARRLADAGRLPPVQVDQAVQQELRAREQWISARESFGRRLDSFKLQLGLPTDSEIQLDRSELERIRAYAREILPEAAATAPSTAPGEQVPPADAPIELVPPEPAEFAGYPISEEQAIALALENRLDLRTSQGRVYDAQRRVTVAADALRAGLNLTASATAGERRGIGSTGSPDAELRFERGAYGAGFDLDLPLERTAERNAYRASLVALEQAVRQFQATEDSIKQEVRNDLSNLLEAREGLRIQNQAVELAQRRVASTTLLLEAGRVEIRDLLDAQEDLLSAQNAFTSAVVNYRLAELELQRDMGVLEVDERGLWQEFDPTGSTP